MQRLFKQFSFPGGIPSHVAPETPGSIHEGGELGYAVSHAYRRRVRQSRSRRRLRRRRRRGGDRAARDLLAFEQVSGPVHDGAVLPILHLNGYKIANPTVLARIPREELEALFVGYGYKPYFVEGDDPAAMHQLMAAHARRGARRDRRDPEGARDRRPGRAAALADDHPQTPKGWTGPKEVDGEKTEGLLALASGAVLGDWRQARAIRVLEEWMRSYRPEELFDEDGALKPEIAALAPKGERRMSANPHANGGLLMRELELPEIARLRRQGRAPGGAEAGSTRGDGRLSARRDA